jgi:hypothetical protein
MSKNKYRMQKERVYVYEKCKEVREIEREIHKKQ